MKRRLGNPKEQPPKRNSNPEINAYSVLTKFKISMKIATINTRGFASKFKQDFLLSYIKQHKLDIAVFIDIDLKTGKTKPRENFIIPAEQDNWMRRKIDGIAPEIAKF